MYIVCDYCLWLHGLGWLLTVISCVRSCGNLVSSNPICCLEHHKTQTPALLSHRRDCGSANAQERLAARPQPPSVLSSFWYVACGWRYTFLLQNKHLSTIFPSQKHLLLILPTLPGGPRPHWEAPLAAVSLSSQLSYPSVSSWSLSTLDDSRKPFASNTGKNQTKQRVLHGGDAAENHGISLCLEKVVSYWCRCSGSLAELQHLLFRVEDGF